MALVTCIACQSADTMHVRGTVYFDQSDKDFVPTEPEKSKCEIKVRGRRGI
jgi:hypothetical protein